MEHLTNGYNRAMSTHVDTEAILAEALRVLLPLAVKDEPDWLSTEGAIERRKAYAAAQAALMAYDQCSPATVTSLSVVQGSDGSLALAS
jgi:hypothetical protein